MNSIPASVSPLETVAPVSLLQPLLPVPPLPASISSASCSRLNQSPRARLAARCRHTRRTSSYLSQSSLRSSVFDSRSIVDYGESEEVEPKWEGIVSECSLEIIPEAKPEPELPSQLRSELSTEPSLLPSLPPSVFFFLVCIAPCRLLFASLLRLRPSQQLSRDLTPGGSIITTPHGSGDTEQSSPRMVQMDSAVTERDISRDVDRLVDELQARGLESQEIVDNVRALRNELRDLADFLHCLQPPRSPVVITQTVQTEPAPTPDAATPRPQRVQSDVSLSRSASNVSSVSFLSSAHSDDFLYEEDMDEQVPSPRSWQAPIADSSSKLDDDSSTAPSIISFSHQ
ncbi:hypothetical protein HYPSUDRAFT_210249 [Hypholoma sublateritium FD-334 SS-4]|uniref:Uncharacterized protein n=1 Tax=Hypholoma sublateritium (strain FD-334 SS-4) TaxID=945553 RepID=A0A0D2KDR3_HYPSF|nr:hypothetical protein HYPSUDRAFT_210249 [Hypholoma sublateritium FD-334 SS-4]